MKKSVLIIVLSIFILSLTNLSAFAKEANSIPSYSHYEIYTLRAGGGGGGGTGGGTAGGYSGYSTGPHSIVSDLFFGILFAISSFGGVILFRLKLSKYARNSKKLMRMLEKQDNAWKYTGLQNQVKVAYYAIQKSWGNTDMLPAKEYMSDEFYESFQTKLSWMQIRNQRNILKNIRLLNAVPVSLHDDSNDSLDYVWFYITGSMVDFIIDTQTNLKASGNIAPTVFNEYWQFIRKDEKQWILNKILQKDEYDQIVFAEDSKL